MSTNIPVLTKLPRHLTGFNLFADGNTYQGLVEELQPAKITVKYDEFQAGTGVAPIAIGLDYEKLEAQFTLGEYTESALALLGQRCQLVLRGSMFVTDGVELPVVITQTGLLVESDMGSWKKGDRSGQLKGTQVIDLITLEINGDEIYHIDNVNGINRVNGKDLTAQRRANLGMA